MMRKQHLLLLREGIQLRRHRVARCQILHVPRVENTTIPKTGIAEKMSHHRPTTCVAGVSVKLKNTRRLHHIKKPKWRRQRTASGRESGLKVRSASRGVVELRQQETSPPHSQIEWRQRSARGSESGLKARSASRGMTESQAFVLKSSTAPRTGTAEERGKDFRERRSTAQEGRT